MLINALCEYYDVLAAQGKVLPSGYSEVGIQYLIAIDENGKVCSIVDWRISEVKEMKGKQKEVFAPRGILLPKRTEKPGIDGNIVEHRPAYLFGLSYDSKNKRLEYSDKTIKSRRAFAEKNLAFLEGIDVPIVNAYRAFARNWEPKEETENLQLLSLGKDLNTARFAVCLAGHPELLLHEVAEVKRKWEENCTVNAEDTDSFHAQCCVTGKVEPIARLHGKIRGFPGGSSMGNTLVSFNNPSDCSYGKAQSSNSAISETAMSKYTEALNYLVSNGRHRAIIDDTTYIFWAASGDERYDDFLNVLAFNEKMDTAETNDWLKTVFAGIREGTASEQILDGLQEIDDGVMFYVMGIKPNSARLAVKCIYRQSFGSILKNVIRHYRDMQIGNLERPVPLWRVARELVSPKSSNEKVSPALMSKIMESVLNGTPYPDALLQTLVRRIKTDSDEENDHFVQMNDIRMGLLKACINRKDRNNGKKEEITLALNTENQDPAYLCGRLFCKLEEIQRRASNDSLNRTIKDAYFAACAARPAVTFPKLLSLSQHHLAKLDKQTAFYLDRDVAEIMGLLGNEFPAVLSLREQGIFMLGYYQQKNERFTKKTAAQDAAAE